MWGWAEADTMFLGNRHKPYREPQVEMDYYWVCILRNIHIVSLLCLLLFHTALLVKLYMLQIRVWFTHTHTYIYIQYIYREIHSYQLFSCDRLALGFPWKKHFPTWKNLHSDLMWRSRSCCSCSHRFHPPPPVRWLSRWRRWTHERVGWSSPLCHGWIIERATWRNHQQNTPKYHRVHETKNHILVSLLTLLMIYHY